MIRWIMDDGVENRQQYLDEMLAAFTDQALNANQDQPIQPATNDAELLALEQMVLRIQKNLASRVPEKETARRIRLRLEQEWHLEQKRARGKPPADSFGIRRLLKGWGGKSKVQRQRTLAFGLAFACMVLVVALVIFLPSAAPPQSGAAGMGTDWMPMAMIILVVAVGMAIWLWRSKRH
jgi:hypothetical protein